MRVMAADIIPPVAFPTDLSKFFVSDEMLADFQTAFIRKISEDPSFKAACLKVLFDES